MRASCFQEKERRKRRPTSVFSNKAAPEDIESILSITLELLDKWGRYYEAAGSPGGAKIVDAWKELTKENVRFPQGPAEYVFLTKPSASRDAGAFGFGSTGGGGGSSSFSVAVHRNLNQVTHNKIEYPHSCYKKSTPFYGKRS